LLDNLGDTFQKLHSLDSAIICYELAAKYATMAGNRELEAFAYSSLGILKWRLGNYNDALNFHFKAYKIRKELNLEKSIAMSANNIGVVYWRLGNYENALQYYVESLNIREKINDIPGIVIANNNIGYIYLVLEQFDRAKSILYESLHRSEEINYSFGKAYTEHLLSILNLKLKNYDSSIEYSKRAIQGYYNKYELNSVANCMNYLGEAYFEKGEFKRANSVFKAALDTALKANDKFSFATTLKNFAKIKFKQKRLSEAEKHLKQSLSISESENFFNLSIESYLIYSQIMKEKGDPKKALEFFEKYSNSLNNLRLEQISANVMEWEAKRKLEKSENENLLLKEKNLINQSQIVLEKQKFFWSTITIGGLIVLLIVFIWFFLFKRKTAKLMSEQKIQLEIANKLLTQMNIDLEDGVQTKNKLISLIAHDLKSPFNSLLNYAALLTDKTHTPTAEEIDQYGMIIMRSSQRLYEVTENLLNWSRIQMKRIQTYMESINLKETIEYILYMYKENLNSKNIKINLKINDNTIISSDKNMLNVILRNIVSNALKFSRNGGTINISAQKENNNLVLGIKDEGLGMSQEKIDLITQGNFVVSSSGTANEKGTGIGLKICFDFMKMLNNKIEIQSEIDKGTTFSLTFPLATKN